METGRKSYERDNALQEYGRTSVRVRARIHVQRTKDMMDERTRVLVDGGEENGERHHTNAHEKTRERNDL